MPRLARFAGLPITAAVVRHGVLEQPSPGAREQGKSRGVHESARSYIVGGHDKMPAEVLRSLRSWLHPHNCDLAGLLRRRDLLPTPGGGVAQRPGQWPSLPWLSAELDSTHNWEHAEGLGAAGSVCAGVMSVDEWSIGS